MKKQNRFMTFLLSIATVGAVPGFAWEVLLLQVADGHGQIWLCILLM